MTKLDHQVDVSTTWGDLPNDEENLNDNKIDVARDGQGLAAAANAFSDNKTDVTTSYGDTDQYPDADNDNKADFAQDSSGFNDPPLWNKTDMDMKIGPNMFPRETGTDSYTEEEAQLEGAY